MRNCKRLIIAHGFIALVTAALGGALVSGCTTSTLLVKKAETTGNNAELSRIGVPYSLPFTTFKIDITRRLVSCPVQMQFKAVIMPLGARPDPVHTYVLDPNSLAGAMKTSDVKLEYFESGSPKSLNVTVEDKTASVIANVASTFAKVVMIAAAAGGAGTAECTDGAKKSLASIKQLTADIALKKHEVDGLSDAVKSLVVKVGAVANQPDAATKKALSTSYDKLQKANQELTDLSDQLAQALDKVTYTVTKYWPRDGDSFSETDMADRDVLNRWIDGADRMTPGTFAVAFAIDPLSKGNNARANNSVQTVAPENGIPLRPPVPAVLRVCRGTVCPEVEKSDNNVFARLETIVPQLGNIYYLACTSRPFSNIGCAFELTEVGQIKTIGTANKAALAEGATATVKNVADELVNLKTAMDALPAKQTKAKTDELKAQADLMAAQAALNPAVGETTALKAQTELYNAQVANAQAEVALRAALKSQAGN
jgi:hypothetical protein